jgi:hypothetical protein
MLDRFFARVASIAPVVPPPPFASFDVPILGPQTQTHRGRVHRVSIVKGGEVSVVLRFGVEEARARGLNQGALIELHEIRPPAPVEVQT